MWHTHLKIAMAVICGLGFAALMTINVAALAINPHPAGVVLANFAVVWNRDLDAVEINWSTAAESDTLGFTVERAISQSGEYSQVIGFEPAAGDPSGAVYGPFFDTEITTATMYWYRLVVYDTNATPDYSISPVVVIADPYIVFLPTLRRDP